MGLIIRRGPVGLRLLVAVLAAAVGICLGGCGCESESYRVKRSANQVNRSIPVLVMQPIMLLESSNFSANTTGSDMEAVLDAIRELHNNQLNLHGRISSLSMANLVTLSSASAASKIKCFRDIENRS